jgi:hypothetical protein
MLTAKFVFLNTWVSLGQSAPDIFSCDQMAVEIYPAARRKFTHLICTHTYHSFLSSHACVDYVAFSSVTATPIKIVVFCYDIACCWIVHLNDRKVGFPKDIMLHPNTTILRVAIPDFHLVGHGVSCQSVYGLLRTPEVGRDASEGIETTWAPTNKIGPSAQEMSRDARRELLDDHFGFSNWEKTKRLGS